MKRNLIPLVPVISAFLLAGCFSKSEGNKNTAAPKNSTPKVVNVAPKNSALKKELSLLQSSDPASRSKAIESIINMPVGKTSMSISVPSKFSSVKKTQK
ncbi:hypothetical protein [Vibrio nigripulchritudo]|uniref:hypothetical protein n=1 Tax=Vibrio nigripulchritudo TaxID=28173 RepID=UPI0005FA75F4|nr:hypothetical protein [Vibrio nigripulchritudo]KJY80696.1 hypothetical protein TW74_03805 [Vibrio nigripulchritudo]